MIDIQKINGFHKTAVHNWHDVIERKASDVLWTAIEDNHLQNFNLWHEEDVARRRDVDDARIVEAKRSIDGFNQARNNAMERIDDWILNFIHQTVGNARSPVLHSETPGMIIDRLSIMALKEYHMEEQTIRTDVDECHLRTCVERLIILQEQQRDLTCSLKSLLEELQSGAKSFKVYRQFKMYNDPNLNPQLYAAKPVSS